MFQTAQAAGAAQAFERQEETHVIRTDWPDGLHNKQLVKISQQQL